MGREPLIQIVKPLREKQTVADPLPEQPLPPSLGAQPPPVSIGQLRTLGIGAAALAALVAVGGIGLRLLKHREVAQWTTEQAIPTVSIIHPQQGVSGVQTVLPGDIQAWYEAPIYARVNGYLKSWYFDYGAHVKKGQVLADIDAPDLDAELAAAQASLRSTEAQTHVRAEEMDFARTTYDRWHESPKGVVSIQETESKKADYGTAVARYNASLADVQSAQGALNRLKALGQFKQLVVPFDGIVTARNTDVGALINAGSGSGAGNAPQLFRVADVHEMRVFVQVPQEMSAGIHAGLTATLHLPQYPDKEFSARVATTAAAISTTSRTLLVELHADNPDGVLQPGTYAEVHFELPSNPQMVRIPTSALIFRQDGMEVAVLGAGDRVELRPVQLGRNLGTDVEVIKGLTPADQVIQSPPDSLSTSDHVRVDSGQGAAPESPKS
jgi:RND family efflux transporter MFP subunit